jgi:hypothetical protein
MQPSGHRPPGPPSDPTRPRYVEASFLTLLFGKPIPNTIPEKLMEPLRDLEEWAISNKRDARRDAVAFWMLKLPAIFASASAGVWAHFDFVTISVIAGAIASVCVIIDGVHPRGMLRNVHLRAFHDIRMLSTKMLNEWRSRNPSSEHADVIAKIIRDAEPQRVKIASYIRDAETALKFDIKE